MAEAKDIWGPFLIIAPVSTLHNWQQEINKFCPSLKVMGYWGNQKERQTIRKYWNPKHLYTKAADFHVVITSYNLVVLDEKYFHRVKWQNMILDEAQALKSSNRLFNFLRFLLFKINYSNRWKTLLKFNCRNRLLLTGTPIQNSMAEVIYYNIIHNFKKIISYGLFFILLCPLYLIHTKNLMNGFQKI